MLFGQRGRVAFNLTRYTDQVALSEAIMSVEQRGNTNDTNIAEAMDMALYKVHCLVSILLFHFQCLSWHLSSSGDLCIKTHFFSSCQTILEILNK